MERMGAVGIGSPAGTPVPAQDAVVGAEPSQVHDVAAPALEASRLPPAHPSPDLVDRVPAEDGRDRRDGLKALAPVEAVGSLDVPRGAPLPDESPVGERLRQVRAREAEPRLGEEPALHLPQQAGGKPQVGVELRGEVPRLDDVRETPRERPPLVRARHPVALPWPWRSPQHPCLRMVQREALREQVRAVGRAVVDEDDAVGRALLGRQRFEEDRQVLRLVEERHDDRHVQARRHRPTPQTPSFWRSRASVTRGCREIRSHAVRIPGETSMSSKTRMAGPSRTPSTARK